jgi:hypothetical protein
VPWRAPGDDEERELPLAAITPPATSRNPRFGSRIGGIDEIVGVLQRSILFATAMKRRRSPQITIDAV